MMTIDDRVGTLASRRILGVRIDATDYEDASRRIINEALSQQSSYVCLGNVSHLMEARSSPEFRRLLEDAHLVTPDGMPLVWLLRLLGIPGATRVYGPDLTLRVLRSAAEAGIPVGFYGGGPQVLRRLLEFTRARFPRLSIVFAEAPPFRSVTRDEDERTVQAIASAGVRILFVGLGTPKQDRWMQDHAGRINAVMLGVGAAFDFLAGAKPQAPPWMQRNGLEWLFRLMTEPRRLWRRYLLQNPRFIALALAQLLRTRLNEHRRTA